MKTTATTTARIPAPRTAPDAVDPVLAYMDFLYGFGAGTDLGALGSYSWIPTSTGCVYRQDFADGIAMANFGDVTADIMLEHPYYDAAGTLHMSVGIEPHTVEVLYRKQP